MATKVGPKRLQECGQEPPPTLPRSPQPMALSQGRSSEQTHERSKSQQPPSHAQSAATCTQGAGLELIRSHLGLDHAAPAMPSRGRSCGAPSPCRMTEAGEATRTAEEAGSYESCNGRQGVSDSTVGGSEQVAGSDAFVGGAGVYSARGGIAACLGLRMMDRGLRGLVGAWLSGGPGAIVSEDISEGISEDGCRWSACPRAPRGQPCVRAACGVE
jgi:hypothetical protein